MASTLPKQLAEQIKQNKEIEDAIRASQAKETGPQLRTVDSGSQQDDTTPSPAPAASSENEGQQDSAGVNGVTPPVAEQPVPPRVSDTSTQQAGDAPLPSPAAPADDPDSDTWQHKYKVLNGKYIAEVPRLARDLAEANRHITELTARIDEMSQQPDPEPVGNQNPVTTTQTSSFITSDQVKEFGEDMVEFARNAAREVVGEQFTTLSRKITDQIGKLTADMNALRAQTSNLAQVQDTTTESSLHQYLDNNIPGWRTQNEDPHFLGWLSQPDQFSGVPRRELLNQAYTKRDAQRVANFFQSFKQENAALTQATQTAQQSPRQERTPPVDVTTLVTPAPASGGEHPAPAESAAQAPGRVISGAEIKKFYADSQRGYYDQHPELYRERESEIRLAIKEGRVSP